MVKGKSSTRLVLTHQKKETLKEVLSAEERHVIGSLVNEVKVEIEEKLQEID